MPRDKKHPAKAVDEKPSTSPAPAHTDPRNDGGFDLDLNSKCPDPELQILLTVLKPILLETIEAAKRCKRDHPGYEPERHFPYHNITYCKH